MEPPAGAIFDDARLQLAFGDVLQVLVDGQLERHAGGRLTLDCGSSARGAGRRAG